MNNETCPTATSSDVMMPVLDGPLGTCQQPPLSTMPEALTGKEKVQRLVLILKAIFYFRLL